MPKYFAYGSNMSPAQIGDRCPSHDFVCAAELRGYRLAFTRYSKNRMCGVADIVRARGESVWGAVFDVNDEDLATLDRNEGVHLTPPAYVRVPVEVFSADGPLKAITYEVFDKAAHGHAPSLEYLDLIAAGARKWDLPEAYQSKLNAIAAAD